MHKLVKFDQFNAVKSLILVALAVKYACVQHLDIGRPFRFGFSFLGTSSWSGCSLLPEKLTLTVLMSNSYLLLCKFSRR